MKTSLPACLPAMWPIQRCTPTQAQRNALSPTVPHNTFDNQVYIILHAPAGLASLRTHILVMACSQMRRELHLVHVLGEPVLGRASSPAHP